MTREPTLEAVNRALAIQVQQLMADLKLADAHIRRLYAELAEARRQADLERGRG